MNLFNTYQPFICDGDIAIVYQGHHDLYPMGIVAGNVMNDKSGSYKHDDFIGQPWGSKFLSHSGKGFLYLLHPTPELWTLALNHRTQILYLADISWITAMLQIRPGSIVVESGTGSGSFTHSLARTVYPNGHVYTFEYHQERHASASLEFKLHGLSQVTCTNRDVCQDGFGLKQMADVVFLDLPTPWDAIPHVKQVLKRDRLTRMACFSPCLEQIQRTFTALVKHGFSHLRLHECLLRNYEIKPVPIKTMDYVRRKHRKKVTEPFQSSLLGRPCQEAKGHTSFVLFAQLLPENHLITSGEITRENEVNEPQGEVLCFESSST